MNGVIMNAALVVNTKEWERLLVVYETLLSVLEDCKASKNLARFSTDVEKQVKDFEKDYPEVVSEYYFSSIDP